MLSDQVKVPFRLGDSGRFQHLTPKQAEIRNRTREDFGEKNLWVRIFEDEQQSSDTKTIAAEKEGSIMAKTKTTKIKKERVSTASRPKWNGHSMVLIARYCGSLDYSYGKTCAVLDRLGLVHSTVRTNHSYGKKGDVKKYPLPELTGKELKELKSVAAEVTDTEAAKAKRKADEASGKPPVKENASKPKAKKPVVAETPKKKKKVKKPAPNVVDDTDDSTEGDHTDDQIDTGIVDDTADEGSEKLAEAAA